MTLRSFLAGVRVKIGHGVESISQWTRDSRQVEIQKRLHQIFKNLVIYSSPGFIDPETVPELELLPFDPENPSSPGLHFFLPWSESKLAEYGKNLALNDTEDRIETMNEIMEILHEGVIRERRPHDTEEFGWIVKRLVWEMETYPRYGTKNDAEPLSAVTKWKMADGVNIHHAFGTLGFTGYKRILWEVYNSWTLSPNVPHVKVLMTYFTNTHPRRLFKAELMVILAVMASRMKLRSLRKHAIVPVMLFSISGPKHGRILTAHYDGEKIKVFRSREYRFFPWDQSNFQLFTRYLASEVKPYGETKL